MKPDEIRIFLEQYAAGDHTETQHQHFMEWLKSAPAYEVEKYLHEFNIISEKFKWPAENVHSSVSVQIEKAIDQYELGNMETGKAKGRISIWRIISRSAAAIFILSLSAYLIYKPEVKKIKGTVTSARTTANVSAGSNKALLTLGDGHIITLDDAGRGAVALQGATQISKMANGHLLYQPSRTGQSEILFNTLTTPRGGQYKLTLPDGSNVWLNSASSIRYPTAFAGPTRNVQITGEVYFEIAHDAAKPFLVNAGEMEVKVLGTHFNVNAYRDESSINTTLLEGSLKLSKAGEVTMLQPGQQAQLSSNGNFHLANDVDLEEVVAWKNGYFSFTKADLQSVLRQIARWYDVEIAYEGAIAPREFGGKIGRSSNISEVLEILQETKVHFRISGKKIIVTP